MAHNQEWLDRQERTRWFLQDRFGMFIHWGLYAIPARGEWVRNVERTSVEDYQVYFDEFDPVDYDPRAWARAARQAGMKYAVLTAKHHDGFCLFDSKLTDYKSTKTKAGRDLVAEFLEAFRAEGLKVGLYYSLIDWHHEDFPAHGDLYHPMRDNEAYKRDPATFDRYLEYMHGQVRELLTNYGKLDLMWFDFSYDGMQGEKWRASELVKMMRSLQPHIVIDNRLEAGGEGGGSIYTKEPLAYAGDFASPEQIIPDRRDRRRRPTDPVGSVRDAEQQLGIRGFGHQLQKPDHSHPQAGGVRQQKRQSAAQRRSRCARAHPQAVAGHFG